MPQKVRFDMVCVFLECEFEEKKNPICFSCHLLDLNVTISYFYASTENKGSNEKLTFALWWTETWIVLCSPCWAFYLLGLCPFKGLSNLVFLVINGLGSYLVRLYFQPISNWPTCSSISEIYWLLTPWKDWTASCRFLCNVSCLLATWWIYLNFILKPNYQEVLQCVCNCIWISFRIAYRINHGTILTWSLFSFLFFYINLFCFFELRKQQLAVSPTSNLNLNHHIYIGNVIYLFGFYTLDHPCFTSCAETSWLTLCAVVSHKPEH